MIVVGRIVAELSDRYTENRGLFQDGRERREVPNKMMLRSITWHMPSKQGRWHHVTSIAMLDARQRCHFRDGRRRCRDRSGVLRFSHGLHALRWATQVMRSSSARGV